MYHHKILARMHLLALFMCIVFYFQPKDRLFDGQQLSEQCEFDTTTLCPECFPKPVTCQFFVDHITFGGYELMSGILEQFNQHAVRFGFLDGERRIVIKNLNRNNMIQTVKELICAELGIAHDDCLLRNNKESLHLLRRWILDEDRLEGAIICPQRDLESLTRLMNKFEEPDLLKLLLMISNVQPLLLKIFSQSTLPVPRLIFHGGFTLVETYDGEPLVKFYSSPLALRMQIATKLIDASINFTKGVDNFRFYLTDISPDNIAVKIRSNEVEVSFVDMNNLIILDSLSKSLDSAQKTTTHTRIECDGCFAYVQNDICAHSYSDINLFAVCQLLLENLNGNRNEGFLYNTENDLVYSELRNMLNHCVYCQPPNCENRQVVLEKIQYLINQILN